MFGDTTTELALFIRNSETCQGKPLYLSTFALLNVGCYLPLGTPFDVILYTIPDAAQVSHNGCSRGSSLES